MCSASPTCGPIDAGGREPAFSANAVFDAADLRRHQRHHKRHLLGDQDDATRGLPGIGLLIPAGAPFAGPAEVDRYVHGFDPLAQDAQTWTGHLGVSLNRDISSWRLALTGNYDHADTRNENDTGLDPLALQAAITAGTVNPYGVLPTNLLAIRPQDTSHSKSDTGNIQFVASGPIYTLPAGQIRTSFRLGATGNTFTSESERGGLGVSETFTQGGGNLQASIDIPLTSAKNKVLPMFGDITVNTHVAVQEVSGFGTCSAPWAMAYTGFRSPASASWSTACTIRPRPPSSS